jgi:hypothetical protein
VSTIFSQVGFFESTFEKSTLLKISIR